MTGVRLDFDEDALKRLAELVAEHLALRGPEPWIGVREAAEHLRCKRQRIYDLVHQRAIPFHKDGARLLFRRSELDAWLTDRVA